MTVVRVSVTTLAEFVHRSGDINYRLEDATTSEEGLATQRKYQAKLQAQDAAYETEKALETTLSFDDMTLRVGGRADGVRFEPHLYVEEIKTTRHEVQQLFDNMGSVHMAQAKLYAAILSTERESTSCECVVTYLHPENDEATMFKETSTRQQLESFLDTTCGQYARFLSTLFQRTASRNSAAAAQPFPFEEYHEEQRRVARRVYAAVRDHENLLLEAPTGTGKTIATIFPHLKAMGSGLLDRVIFTSAKTTGQHIAQETITKLSASNEFINGLSITAKERICLTPGALCTPDQCEYAQGYFDKMPEARDVLLKQGFADRDAVTRVAKAFGICPWNLQLDAAEWMDFLVCDYNYVFDPLVGLKRLKNRQFTKVAVLVDEAHRLGERVREMLSAAISLELLQRGIDSTYSRAVVTNLLAMRDFVEVSASTLLEEQDEAELPDIPKTFWAAVDASIDAILGEEFTSTTDDLYACLFELIRVRTIKELMDVAQHANFIKKTGQDTVLVIRCLAPGMWLNDRLDDYSNSVRFSGTLSPPSLFQEAHGVDGPVVRAQSVLDPDRFGVCIVNDISTYYRQRERTAESIRELLRCVRDSTEGNWLVALPSYAYLQLIAGGFDDDQVRLQEPNISLDERMGFIEWINEAKSRLAFVVMGGVFTESVDFEPSSLAGVVVIGPALPPSSLELERIRDASPNGFEFAYRQPAMARVIQAAGRVVRGENDYGMVILIDPRFTHWEYEQYFPSHWQPKFTRATEVPSVVRSFFRRTAVFSG